MKKLLLAWVVLFVIAQTAISQTWQLTGSGTNDWLCIASSANGETLVAGQWGGAVAVSTNAGATLTDVLTNGFWSAVASSADGKKLLAAASYIDSAHISGVYLSTNSGASWVSNDFPVFYWGPVAMSADGSTMVAAAAFGPDGFPPSDVVFSSTNSGVSWASNNIATTTGVNSTSAVGMAMSADGSKIFVVDTPIVCYSTNFGASWTQMTNAPAFDSFVSPSQMIASSEDGNKLIVCVPSSAYEVTGVYISTNSGNTWSLTSLPETNWMFVASSADAQTLVASAGGFSPGPLYVSTNSGISWTTNTSQSWGGVASSADGGALFAVGASNTNFNVDNGVIYSSQSIQPPLLSMAPAGSQTLLSWLIPSTNFVLEQSFNLKNWSAVTNSPALNPANLQEQVLVSPTNRAGFYRLATVPGN